MNISVDGITQLLSLYLWTFFRVGALVSIAPIFGTRTVPVKIKLGLAVLITMVIGPIQDSVSGIELLSFAGISISFQQIIIGLLMGFIMRLVFSAVESGAHIASLQMGLGFASMVDPQTGITVPMLSQFYSLLSTLIFLSIDGHLTLLSVLSESFHFLPVGGNELSNNGLMNVALAGGWIFSGGLILALPAVAALLMVNMAFGIMSRSAPQLNIFSIGFPITMLLGFILIWLTIPTILPIFLDIITTAFSDIRTILVAK